MDLDLLPVSTAGLTTQDAQERLAEFGPNDPLSTHRTARVVQLLLFFANPLIVILLIASFISAVLGEIVNAAIIVLIVLFSVALNFIQTYRSQRAVERLKASIAPAATVLRDGAWSVVPRSDVMPGDVIRLSAGNVVPADAYLIEGGQLHVQQAALTGESLPVEKEAGEQVPQPPYSPDNPQLIFLGTSVISGTAFARVLATGPRTIFGEIAGRLAVRPPETEFERGTRRFGFFLTRVVLFLVVFVFLVSAVLRHDPFESLLFAIALAVGLTPEFLPMITAITLSQGAVHMARRKVLVKHLEAIQNFGSMDVLCCDKTGTLTAGEMALDRHLDPLGNPSERVFLLAYLNSFYQAGIKHPHDEAILQQGIPNPLDTAILLHGHPDIGAYRRVAEIPFDFERRCVSVVVDTDHTQLLIAKGAPESLLQHCSAYEVNDRCYPIDEAFQKRCEAYYQDLGEQGLHVLAIAYRSIEPQEKYSTNDEHDMVLAGFATFVDPPREDAAEVLKALSDDGVEVKILTGDNDRVARQVCAKVGLDVRRIVLGDELDRMSDIALAHVAEQTDVFARVSPAQKNRIILALKNRSHVVGFLGDGINDAPSIHAADVGISVSGGVEVAKEAADIILLEQSLAVLHQGILEGRKAFGNVMKYLLMGTSSNFGNMFSMAGAVLFLPFLPMLPTQILLNNALYDLAQVTIPTDTVDPSYIHKPRRWDISLIRDFMLLIGPISSLYDFMTFFVMLTIFHASEPLFHTGWFVESLATQTLVIFIIRTAGNPLRSTPSRPLTLTTLLIVLVGILLPFTPVAGALGFMPLPGLYFIFLVAATATYLCLVEIVKRRLMRRLQI